MHRSAPFKIVESPRLSKQWPIIAIVSSLLLFYFWQRLAFGIGLQDDAYITLSHARSLVLGQGLIASPENPVCATSSPLYALLLALSAFVFGISNLEITAYALGILGESLSLVLIYGMLQQLGYSYRGALLGVTAYMTSLAFYATGASGMETSLYIALILAGHYASLAANPSLRLTSTPLGTSRSATGLGMGMASFFSALIRPEGILLAVALSVSSWRRMGTRLSVLIPLFFGLLGCGAFLGMNQWAWGHLLPHSILAKHVGVRVGIWDSLHSWYLNLVLKGPMVGGTRVLGVVLTLILLLAILGWWRHKENKNPLLELGLWPLLYVGFFLFSGASYRHFNWYFVPPLPLVILILGIGSEKCLKQIVASYPSLKSRWESSSVPLICTFLLILLASLTAGRLHPADSFRQALAHREERYAEVSQYLILRGAKERQETLLTDEVGVFLYRSRLPLLDFHGLLNPEVLPFVHNNPHYGPRLLALAAAFHPPWIAWTVWGRPDQDTLYGEYGELDKNYQLVKRFREPNSPHVLHLWRRKSLL